MFLCSNLSDLRTEGKFVPLKFLFIFLCLYFNFQLEGVMSICQKNKRAAYPLTG